MRWSGPLANGGHELTRQVIRTRHASPAAIRFADACRVATHCFGPPRLKGSSHHVWKMPGQATLG